MENLPSFRQLQYLTALHRYKSFSRAAEASHVTQSTFSAGIAALETLLGQPIITRTTRHVVFTALGEDIAEKAKTLIASATELVNQAKKRDGLSGPLRLGVIPTIAPYMLPRLLPTLAKNFSELELQLHEDISSRLVARLEKGSLDVLILALPFETPGCRQLKVFSEDFVLATSDKKHASQPVSQTGLENIDLLLLEEGHCLRTHALSACRAQSPAVRKTFSATSLSTLIQMVQHGAGATLLPEMAADPALLPKGIYLRRFAKPAPTREIGLVWKTGPLEESDIGDLARTIKSCQKQG